MSRKNFGKKHRVYFETERSVTVTRKGFIDIDIDYTQFYVGLVEIFGKIKGICTLKLLAFLFFETNNNNMFSWNDKAIEKFNSFQEKPFNPQTVRRSLKELLELEVVHKAGNGSYWLDPRYSWTGSIIERTEMISSQQQFLTKGQD